MEVHRVIILLCTTGLLILESTARQLLYKEFRHYFSPSVGPVRLSAGWTDRSLISCIVSCMNQYLTQCESVMYNGVTQFCTPGQWLDQSQPLPNADEGDLYIANPCNVSGGFQYFTYRSAQICLFDASKSRLNFLQADAFCQTINSSLYTIKTVDKFILLRNLYPMGQLWIGLDDIQTEDVFVWRHDGSVLDANTRSLIFTNGDSNNNPAEEDCAAMWAYPDNKINDVNCTETLGFLCESPGYL